MRLLMLSRFLLGVVVALGLAGCPARAAGVDPATMYEVKADAAPVKHGEPGKLLLTVHAKSPAHISDEAPLKVELSGKNVSFPKATLTRADSLGKKSSTTPYPDPHFEVAFVPVAAGKGELAAKLTFFVCTEQLCSRQQHTVTVPVDAK